MIQTTPERVRTQSAGDEMATRGEDDDERMQWATRVSEAREPRDLRREVGRCETGGKQAGFGERPRLVHMGTRLVLRVPGRASGCACTVYANARGRRRAPPSDTAAARAARHAPTDFAFCDSLCTTDPPEPACTDVANSIEPADCSATRDTYHRYTRALGGHRLHGLPLRAQQHPLEPPEPGISLRILFFRGGPCTRRGAGSPIGSAWGLTRLPPTRHSGPHHIHV